MPKEKAEAETKTRNDAPPVAAVTEEPPDKESGPIQAQRAAETLQKTPICGLIFLSSANTTRFDLFG